MNRRFRCWRKWSTIRSSPSSIHRGRIRWRRKRGCGSGGGEGAAPGRTSGTAAANSVAAQPGAAGRDVRSPRGRIPARLGQAVGRSTTNRVINFPGSPEDVGRYLKVKVTSAGPNSLVGSACGRAATVELACQIEAVSALSSVQSAGSRDVTSGRQAVARQGGGVRGVWRVAWKSK